MRVGSGGTWIADSENALVLFEPGRYPLDYFPKADISLDSLHAAHTTRHSDLGLRSWYTVQSGEKTARRGAWQHMDLPVYASEFRKRTAFAWTAMDAFYDQRIPGHALNSYHRIDIRQTAARPRRSPSRPHHRRYKTAIWKDPVRGRCHERQHGKLNNFNCDGAFSKAIPFTPRRTRRMEPFPGPPTEEQ